MESGKNLVISPRFLDVPGPVVIDHLAVGFLSEAPFAHLLASLPLPPGLVVIYFLSTDFLHASDVGGQQTLE